MGKSLCLLLALTLLLLKIPPSCSSMRCKEHELEALLKFKHSCTADPTNLLSSWVGDDCCVWVGVTCDSLTGNVVKLNLRNQDGDFPSGVVSSKLSSALLELKYLTHLDLSYNDFNGSRIPDFIGSMTSLRYLNLSNAGFSGLLPPQLGNLTNLIHLDLNYALGDFMPQKRLEWLNGLSKLQTLDLTNINLMHATDALQVHFRFPSMSSLSLSYCILNNTHSSELLIANISNTMSATLRHLDLSRNEFEGPFPSFVRQFGSLHFLSLAFNRLNGSIPVWLKSMRQLEYLDLSFNEISGTFPSEFGQLTNLVYLDLRENNISGTFPSEFGQLTNLVCLDLRENNISGTFPSEFGQLTNLTYLDLALNMLHGQFPASFAKLSALKHLDLSQNGLTGWMPPILRHLIEIEYLDISSNKIQGTISVADISNHSKLSYFDTNFNNINLDLSIDWRPPFQLEAFNVHSCGINTSFPQWLRNQTQIRSLELSYTGISGEFPQWIRNLTNVQNLKLGGNKLTGSLPLGNTFGEFESILEVVDVHNNMLSGTIPHWLQQLDCLEVLDLSNNFLSGASIFEGENSTSLFNSPMLLYLDLSLNAFSGEIRINNPTVNPYIAILRLRGNHFSGVIGSQLCLFSSLAILDLAQNRFTGHIPRCLGSLAFGTSVWGNSYSVEIQEIIKGVTENFTRLDLAHTTIDLSSNHLVGAIPEELTNISKLNALILSNNHLTGGIPRSIGNLQLLESLDLSNNNLSGTIPQSLTDIPWLSILNLSNNNLHGPIPNGNQLQTLDDPFIYAGNSGLCGFPLPKCSALNSPPLPSNDGSSAGDDDDGEDKKEKMWFYLVVMSGVATGFWGVVGTLVFNKRWRHAYFRFVEDTADRIYVPLRVRMNRYKNRQT